LGVLLVETQVLSAMFLWDHASGVPKDILPFDMRLQLYLEVGLLSRETPLVSVAHLSEDNFENARWRVNELRRCDLSSHESLSHRLRTAQQVIHRPLQS
jgi:hypothetical protein